MGIKRRTAGRRGSRPVALPAAPGVAVCRRPGVGTGRGGRGHALTAGRARGCPGSGGWDRQGPTAAAVRGPHQAQSLRTCVDPARELGPGGAAASACVSPGRLQQSGALTARPRVPGTRWGRVCPGPCSRLASPLAADSGEQVLPASVSPPAPPAPRVRPGKGAAFPLLRARLPPGGRLRPCRASCPPPADWAGEGPRGQDGRPGGPVSVCLCGPHLASSGCSPFRLVPRGQGQAPGPAPAEGGRDLGGTGAAGPAFA